MMSSTKSSEFQSQCSSATSTDLVRSSASSVPEAHTCPYVNCLKSFSKKYNLKAHLRLHTGELPFECDRPNCNKKFKWRSSLSSHAVWHTRKESASIAASNAKQQSIIPQQHQQQQQQQFQPQQQPLSPQQTTQRQSPLAKSVVVPQNVSTPRKMIKPTASHLVVPSNMSNAAIMSPSTSSTLANHSNPSLGRSPSPAVPVCPPAPLANVPQALNVMISSNKRPRSVIDCVLPTNIKGNALDYAQTSCESLVFDGCGANNTWTTSASSRARASRAYRILKKRRKLSNNNLASNASMMEKKRIHTEINEHVSEKNNSNVRHENIDRGEVINEEETLVSMELLDELPGSPVTSYGSGNGDVLDSDLFDLPVLPLFTRGHVPFEFGGAAVSGIDGTEADDGFFGSLPLDCRLDGFEMDSLPAPEV